MYLAAQYACTVAAQHAALSSSSPSGPGPRSKIFAKFTAAHVPWRLRGGRLYHTHNGVLAQRMQCSAATGKNVRQRARARARAQTKAELQSTTPDLHTYQHSVLSGSCIIAAALLL